jgi:hypothetical protein
VESNSILEVEEVVDEEQEEEVEEEEEEEEPLEELPEEPEEDQLLFMVLDFKVLPNHHLMVTIDSQQPMLSIEMDASSLTPTKV